MTFCANGDFSKFVGVKVDFETVEKKNYRAWSGSTYVKLSKEYLNTLSAGKHTLTYVYTDGECSADFEILGTEAVPTGDNSNIVIWSVFAALSAAGALSAMRFKKFCRELK